MMITRGPVDVLVLAIGEPHFDGSVLTELERQVTSGTIRVLDIMVLMKDQDGQRLALDIKDLQPDQAAKLGFSASETHGLFNREDADTLYEGMVNDSAIAALALEHTWAVALVNAIAGTGAEVALNFRVPAPIVDEAFASLAASA
ncbi:MAG: hypothetical protein HGA45_30150 [Chloroflexales bacterium]|nr:hypothetical protein [Chloroflexales bacterium]